MNVLPLRKISSMLVLVPCVALAVAARADEGQTQPADATSPAQVSQSGDAGIAAWLAIHYQKQSTIRELAAARANDQAVRDFARQAADAQSQRISALQSGDGEAAEPDLQFGEMLQQVADKLEQRRQAGSERRVLGFRGTEDEPLEELEETVEDEDLEQQTEETIEVGAEDAEQTAGSGRDEGRRQLRDEREDVREARRLMGELHNR